MRRPNSKPKYAYEYLLLAVVGVAFVAAIAMSPAPRPFFSFPQAQAQTTNEGWLSGYAWSETIGWISFNSGVSTYGVYIAENEESLYGYAWSENIGWISFNNNEVQGCPSAPCGAKIVNGALTGWARACAGTINGDCTGATRTDGWDGWISLSGPILPGGTNDSGVFSGYAWGSTVVGWLDFAGVNAVWANGTIYLDSFVEITAEPKSVWRNTSTTISWTSSGVGNCSITGPALSAQSTSGSQSVLITAVQSTFTITCRKLEGGSPTGPEVTNSTTVTGRNRPIFQEI